MESDTTQRIEVPERTTRRVRLELENARADKLRAYAAARGRTQASIIEYLIDELS